ncbi:hypothetical protein ANCDUO_12571 [Ancylostoma duodenale]|uniref:Uncharacterized protein n=1 Tax=Ancylostoma duodenale TaxID=51022 RepID=A0A0C2GE82_9BILA|nr:hypothetical protein ANCDUO_12571 [Ancylostoma duodenale]
MCSVHSVDSRIDPASSASRFPLRVRFNGETEVYEAFEGAFDNDVVIQYYGVRSTLSCATVAERNM